MILGEKIERTNRIPVENSRPFEPVLIVGKHSAHATLRRLFLQDVYEGFGATFFGKSKNILQTIPRARIKDTVLFELDYDFPRSFNPLEFVSDKERSAIADNIVEAFAATWPSDIPTTLLDNNLLAASLAMLSIQSGTLYSARHLFTSERYRKQVIGHIKDNDLKNAWQLFDELEPREQRSQASSILNRLIPLTTDPWYRNIIAQAKSFTLKPTDILVVDLPDTRKGTLLAALLMARLTGRVYIDSPHIFVGGGQPIMACDYLDQLPESLRTKFIGTATLIASRLGVKDAETLAPEFNLPPQGYNLSDLPPSKAFLRQAETTLITVPESEYPEYPEHAQRIINRSRSEYSTPKQNIEKKINSFIRGV